MHQRHSVPLAVDLFRISGTTFPSPPGRGARGEGSNGLMLLRERGQGEGSNHIVLLRAFVSFV
ncbi:MAG: hypothetical protein A2W68_18845 [Betaproteobacteria bacterium RIFCSPLOWO2_02_64_14]|nr:MAG: hypothetical protein A2W68_18845 [Betaproteobacteria bacterium RIFCSPLOWO2_02_64_14]